MKRILSLISAITLCLCLTSCAPSKSYEANVTDLGIPFLEVYRSGGLERCAWDIEFFDNALYAGGGDYDRNCGPIYISHYDFDTATWEVDDVLKDEQIERFYVFDDTLYAPGYDPRTSWEFGNYYTCRDNTWETHNVLPNGVHNFDLVKFDGKLFAGLGVTEGNSPVVVSSDEENWEQVPLIKGGKTRDTAGGSYIRVYDFFVLEDTLYAYFYLNSETEKAREIYRYDGTNFIYHSSMLSDISLIRHKYSHISQKVEFKGNQYFCSEILYKSSDMVTAEQIDVGENVEVNDLRVIGNALYLLCDEKITHEDGSEEFRISVKKSKNGKTFNELFYFYYPVRALSFTHNEDTFYFGMGYGITSKDFFDENGVILSVTHS